MKITLSSSFFALLAAVGTVSGSPVSSSLTAKGLDICSFKGITCDLTKWAACFTVKYQPNRPHGHCCSISNEDKCKEFLGDGCTLAFEYNRCIHLPKLGN
ncbi:hypothetical protein C8R47DRAFT_1091048 [Mycena vitilis]|nr:hypothetical protein C8R47DRAFT_1091048 [Mycena vitilis]